MMLAWVAGLWRRRKQGSKVISVTIVSIICWWCGTRQRGSRGRDFFGGGRGEGKDGDLDKEGERRRINTRASVVVRTSRLSSQCSPRPGATSQPPKKKRK